VGMAIDSAAVHSAAIRDGENIGDSDDSRMPAFGNPGLCRCAAD
jgi:hypothetical protein